MKKINRKALIIALAAVLAVAIVVTVVVVVCTRSKSDETYTVTFNSNGGTAVESITGVAHNSRIAEPAAPTRLGYIFGGWYKQKELADVWRFNRDRVVADITLYAKWNYNATQGLQMELKAGGTYTVTGMGNVTDGVIVVPSVYESLPVTAVAREAFAKNVNITAVILPDSIVTIESRAFDGCTALTEAVLPNNATMGEYVFNGCKNLVKVNLPANLTTVPRFTFNECHSLAAIEFPSGLKTIGERAFYECRKLVNFAFPNGLERIESNAFSGCHALTAVNIPSTVKEIGLRAFSNCVSVDTLTVARGSGSKYYSANNCIISDHKLIVGCKSSVIPSDSVTVIGESAFQGCQELTRINSLVGVRQIDDYAFMGCSSVKRLSIPSSVTSIGVGAFSYCESLESVSFTGDSPSLKSVGKEAFASCGQIGTIVLPASVERIGAGAFHECTNDGFHINYQGTIDGWNNVKICSEGEDTVNEDDQKLYTEVCNVYCVGSENASVTVTYLK